MHLTPALEALRPADVFDPFPKPGTKWKPLHRRAHLNNKPISIRRFISLAEQEKKST
jgi:hypothetical protein